MTSASRALDEASLALNQCSQSPVMLRTQEEDYRGRLLFDLREIVVAPAAHQAENGPNGGGEDDASLVVADVGPPLVSVTRVHFAISKCSDTVAVLPAQATRSTHGAENEIPGGTSGFDSEADVQESSSGDSSKVFADVVVLRCEKQWRILYPVDPLDSEARVQARLALEAVEETAACWIQCLVRQRLALLQLEEAALSPRIHGDVRVISLGAVTRPRSGSGSSADGQTSTTRATDEDIASAHDPDESIIRIVPHSDTLRALYEYRGGTEGDTTVMWERASVTTPSNLDHISAMLRNNNNAALQSLQFVRVQAPQRRSTYQPTIDDCDCILRCTVAPVRDDWESGRPVCSSNVVCLVLSEEVRKAVAEAEAKGKIELPVKARERNGDDLSGDFASRLLSLNFSKRRLEFRAKGFRGVAGDQVWKLGQQAGRTKVTVSGATRFTLQRNEEASSKERSFYDVDLESTFLRDVVVIAVLHTDVEAGNSLGNSVVRTSSSELSIGSSASPMFSAFVADRLAAVQSTPVRAPHTSTDSFPSLILHDALTDDRSQTSTDSLSADALSTFGAEMSYDDWRLLGAGGHLHELPSIAHGSTAKLARSSENTNIFFIERGAIDISSEPWSTSSAENDERRYHLHAGMTFGEMSMLGYSARRTQRMPPVVEGHSDDGQSSLVREIDMNSAQGLFDENPELATRFFLTIARRLSQRLRDLPVTADGAAARNMSSTVGSRDAGDRQAFASHCADTHENFASDVIRRISCSWRISQTKGKKVLLKKHSGSMKVFSDRVQFGWKVFALAKHAAVAFDQMRSLKKDGSSLLFSSQDGSAWEVRMASDTEAKEAYSAIHHLLHTGADAAGAHVEHDHTHIDSEAGRNKAIVEEERDWAEILKCATKSSFRPGDVVARRGEHTRRLFQIVRGCCAVVSSDSGTEGEDRVIAVLQEGEVFGELSFLEPGRPVSATVVAAEISIHPGDSSPERSEVRDEQKSSEGREDEGIELHVIDGKKLTSLLLERQDLAARFAKYLAGVIAERIVAREMRLVGR